MNPICNFDLKLKAPLIQQVVLSITKLKRKDGYLSKLIITKSRHQATQYKKFIDALPGFCTYKNYKYINAIICTSTTLTKDNFLSAYPVTT